ncbi:MAG: hypothetical protein KAI99_09690 [Cyclobacteriaceae bacterium]|nr:hypothetical protein [Cyclobacteriaceae bacterium]
MEKLLSHINKKRIAFFLVFLILFYTVGCKYFKVKKVPANEIESIHNIGEIHKSFFVHEGEKVYSLKDIAIDSAYISGYLDLASYYHLYEGRNFRYNEEEANILNEVHIYLKENSETLILGTTEIPLSAIETIRIVEKDSGKTAASYTFGTFGIILGVLVIISIIAALLKSSCPYVYAHDGEAFIFEGEIYGGAIASNLQRDDYMPLPSLQPSNETYRIRISNELKERQYTDLAQLVVVEHKSEQKVLLDKEGKPHLVHEVNKPTEAVSYSGENLLPSLIDKDMDVFFFNDEDHSQNGIVMKFTKPEKADMGKLVLNGKNTLWFDYQFGEFLSMFGGIHDEYMDQQSQIPNIEREQRIIDNDFPLSIYVKKEGAWILVDYLYTVGPLASRDFVIPIDLSEIKKDQVEIMVETGFMFWELDFVGMDYTVDEDVKVDYLKPVKALGTGSKDWTTALSVTDHQYMSQEHVGEVTEIIYRAIKPQKNHRQTYFLHTSGYYELIRDFQGLPKLVELNKFKKNGYFSEFSRAKYLKVLDRENRIASIKTIN